MNKIKFKERWYVILLVIAGSAAFKDFMGSFHFDRNIFFIFCLLFLLKVGIIFMWSYASSSFILFLRIWLSFYLILYFLGFFNIYQGIDGIDEFKNIEMYNIYLEIFIFFFYIILLVFSGKQIQYVNPIISDENFQSGGILKESNQQLEQKLTFNYPWYNALIVLGFMYSIFNTTTVILENTFLITGIIVLLLKILAIYFFFENSKYFILIFRVLCLFYVLPFLFHLLKILYRVLILDQSFVHHFNFYFQLIILLYFSALFIESWGRIKLEWIKTPANLEQSE